MARIGLKWVENEKKFSNRFPLLSSQCKSKIQQITKNGESIMRFNLLSIKTRNGARLQGPRVNKELHTFRCGPK